MKKSNPKFSLLLWNYLLILKILPVTRFKDPKAANLTLKMLTGSCLWFCLKIWRLIVLIAHGNYFCSALLFSNSDSSPSHTQVQWTLRRVVIYKIFGIINNCLGHSTRRRLCRETYTMLFQSAGWVIHLDIINTCVINSLLWFPLVAVGFDFFYTEVYHPILLITIRHTGSAF